MSLQSDTNFMLLTKATQSAKPEKAEVLKFAELTFIEVDKNGDGLVSRDEMVACLANALKEILAG